MNKNEQSSDRLCQPIELHDVAFLSQIDNFMTKAVGCAVLHVMSDIQ